MLIKKHRNLNDILSERDTYRLGSIEWHNLNKEKAFVLQNAKPSLKEKISYMLEVALNNIDEGFTLTNQLPSAHLFKGKRAELEYNGGLSRHPIPYCLVRYKDEYYFILREGGTESRLQGKIGLLGGHVLDIEEGMMRELEEEARITQEHIKNINLIALIKSNGDSSNPLDVSRDHLGLIYEIELKNKNIAMEELGIQKGMWVTREEMVEISHRFEDWLNLIYKNMFAN